MSQRFSGINANINGLNESEKDWLLYQFKAMNSISHTTMDDWAYTVRCAEALPNTLFGHRAWNPFHVDPDTTTYLKKDAETWAQWVHTFPKHPNILHHMLNEPTSDNVPYLVDWLIEAMELTGKNGKYPTRCIVGNLAVDKSFQHIGDSIRWRDDWLRFFRAFVKHHDWHILGLHRYWIGDYRLALTDGYPANVKPDHPNHKDFLDSSKWQLKLERLANGHLPPHWHGYADLWAKQLCIENGISLPSEMITEDWLDEKRDRDTQPFIQWMDNTYPTEYNNGKMRGIWTYKRWSEAITGLPYHVSLKAQLEAKTKMHLRLEKDYPQLRGKQRGSHVFSFTKSPDWEAAGHSIYTPPNPSGKYIERHQFIFNMSTITPFTQEPQPMPESQYNDYDVPMKAYTVRTTINGFNVRNAPTTTGDDIGDMPLAETECLRSVDKVNTTDRWDWYKIDLLNGVQGFVAQNAGETTPNIFKPVATDEPDTGDETPTDEQWQQLRDEIIEVKTKFAALEAQINRELEMVHIDVPYAGGIFTYSVPRFALKTEIARSKGLGEWQQQNEDALRRADGQVLLKDVEPDIFGAQSHVTAEPSIDINTNFAVDDSIDATFDEQGNLSISLGIGNEELLENMERTITDNEDTEDGKPAA